MLADPPVRHAPAWILVALALGFYLPPLWLRGRITERQAEIGRALPDALDLIITCVEAGIGVDAALDRVAGEVRLSAPLLAGELQQASREMRAGVPRGESFRRLARRTGVDELRTLAAVVVQTELFGTSLAATLRVQADGIRTRRTQVAEERAGKVGVLLSVPLILCILPALFVVLIGPAIVSFVRVLMPTLMGK
jgi:tight adherence protein C